MTVTVPKREFNGYQRLLDVARELSTAHTLDSVTAIVRRAARDLTGSDGATFVLLDGPFCHYADEEAIGPLWKGQRFPAHTCISGWAMLHDEHVAIRDIYEDPRIPHDAYRPTFVKSLLMVPIRRGNPIGAIGNYWADHRDPLPIEVELTQALADLVSVTMSNLELIQERERRMEELAAASRTRDHFLMIVSHELRTPLAQILGWVGLLRSGKLDAEQQKSGLAIVEQSARFQEKLIGDLFDTSRILAGKLSLSVKPFDVVALLKLVVESNSVLAKERGIHLEFTTDRESQEISGDPTRLRQVFLNLVTNAIKFSQPMGTVHIAFECSGPSARVRVTDHGEGIAADFLPFVFDRFSQGDNTLKRKIGGLGLGLTIVKHLVDAHGGVVTAQSAGPGQGATFEVALPLSTPVSLPPA